MEIDPNKMQPHEWAGTAVLSALAIALGLQRVINLFKRGRVDGVKEDAERTLVSALRDDVEHLRADLEEERSNRKKMDEFIHEQSIRLTRTQTALLRLIDLLKQKRISIPEDVQSDIDVLFQREKKA